MRADKALKIPASIGGKKGKEEMGGRLKELSRGRRGDSKEELLRRRREEAGEVERGKRKEGEMERGKRKEEGGDIVDRKNREGMAEVELLTKQLQDKDLIIAR